MFLLGMDSSKVDLILQKETYKLGDSVHGCFLIKGGTIEQQIKRIDCDLIMSDHTALVENVIDTTTILTSRRIHSGELNKTPFTLQLPVYAPISSQEVSYHFRTRLTFNKGVDSRDRDIIQIIQ